MELPWGKCGKRPDQKSIILNLNVSSRSLILIMRRTNCQILMKIFDYGVNKQKGLRIAELDETFK
jgi:hypothetical protein